MSAEYPLYDVSRCFTLVAATSTSLDHSPLIPPPGDFNYGDS